MRIVSDVGTIELCSFRLPTLKNTSASGKTRIYPIESELCVRPTGLAAKRGPRRAGRRPVQDYFAIPLYTDDIDG
jgi:hypothetical protein